MSASSKDYNPQTGEWNVGDLANGSTVTLQITVIIEKVGTYGNTVFVYCNETDTNMTNNNASSEKVVVTEDKNPNNNTDNNGTGHHGSVSTMPATGNPIMVLLAVLLVLIFPVLRRFEK